MSFSAPVLPAGTVTFLFTDIEGSSRLWERYPEEMRVAMARHDALVESAVVNFQGMLVRPRGEGDSRFAVFQLATDAVQTATSIQRLLAGENWNISEPIKVRIGLHTGGSGSARRGLLRYLRKPVCTDSGPGTRRSDSAVTDHA